MTINTLIPKADISSSRSTVTNWKNKVKEIVDSYSARHSISHGVQKDAIQNGWDARTDKRHAKNWLMKFELIKGKDKNTYFTMTDSGTTGLTGRVLQPEELETDLPIEERWGRFENVAFTKSPEEEALGARGRGKFIFVGASENYVILYDTLKPDGSYRLGFRTIELTDSKINCFDDDEGRKKLVEYTKKTLKPLDKVGTRIIIVNPVKEFIDDYKSESFLRYIEETWWEIIAKCDVKIYTIDGKTKKTAKAPKEFVLYDKDSTSFTIWKKDNEKVRVGRKEYRIKHLHFVCSLKKEVPEDLHGVAIQRGGM
ncbi:hypothetical protein KAW55_02530, partial [bacterium]|nr:hypothetical protein [bacterium]